jgi:hypothetical protein
MPLTDEERAALQKQIDNVQAAAALEAAEHADLVLELKAKYSSELGPQGRAWQIVNEENLGGMGPIVVKLPDATVGGPLHKKWQAADNSIESVTQYTLPAVVYPDAGKYGGIASSRPLLAYRTGQALSLLFGERQGEALKKL